jgi:hypothetical protein
MANAAAYLIARDWCASTRQMTSRKSVKVKSPRKNKKQILK